MRSVRLFRVVIAQSLAWIGLLSLGIGSAHAQGNLGLTAQGLSVSGNGCPGSAMAQPIGATAFQLRFDRLRVQGGEPTTTCNVVLAFMVPARVSVRLVGAELSGTAMLSNPGGARVQRDYSLAGQRRGSRVVDLDPGFRGSFLFQDDVRDQLPNPRAGWTPCSESPTVQSAMLLVRISAEGDGSSLIVNLGRVFNLETQRCSVP